MCTNAIIIYKIANIYIFFGNNIMYSPVFMILLSHKKEGGYEWRMIFNRMQGPCFMKIETALGTSNAEKENVGDNYDDDFSGNAT